MKPMLMLSLFVTIASAQAQTGGGANGGADAEPAWDGAVATLLEFMGDGLVESLGVASKPEVIEAIAHSTQVNAQTLTPELKKLILRMNRPEFTDQELEIPGRTCVNRVAGQIICNRPRYTAEKARGTNVVTTLHEYLGVLGVETNQGDTSTYPISKYAANFLSLETRQVWVLRKKQAIPTQSSVTYRHALIDELHLQPLAKKYGLEEVATFAQNNETGERIAITCAVTMESLYRSQDSKIKKTRKLLEKLPTGFAVTYGRHVSAPIDENYSGTITLKPGGTTISSLDVVFLFDLFAQKMGTPEFYDTGEHHPLGGCVQPASLIKDQGPDSNRGVELGWAKKGDRATLLAPSDKRLDEPNVWQLVNVGDNLKANLFCGYADILRTYQKLNLELVCAYGAYTN